MMQVVIGGVVGGAMVLGSYLLGAWRANAALVKRLGAVSMMPSVRAVQAERLDAATRAFEELFLKGYRLHDADGYPLSRDGFIRAMVAALDAVQ